MQKLAEFPTISTCIAGREKRQIISIQYTLQPGISKGERRNRAKKREFFFSAVHKRASRLRPILNALLNVSLEIFNNDEGRSMRKIHTKKKWQKEKN